MAWFRCGGGVDVDFVTAGAGDILAGKTGCDRDGNPVPGSIPTKGASDLSASGKTVTVPAGHYPAQVTKDIAAGSATGTGSAQQSEPDISVSDGGLITASVAAKNISVTPAVQPGYVGSGTAGNVSLTANSATKQMTTQGAKTVTPSTSEQTAVAKGVFTTGIVKVGAIQTETKTATGNGDVTPASGKFLSKVTVSIPTQGAKTVTPSTSEQTAVASGKLTTGAVKVSGDANLVAANIVNGKSIFGVSGNARKFASMNGSDFTGEKYFGGTTSLGTKPYKRITGHGFTPAFGGTYPTSNMVMITGSYYITLSNWYSLSGDWSSSAIDLPFNVSVSQGSAIWYVNGYY